MRLLNLAVPILYRDVVNVMSDASSAAHPRGSEAPESTPFWQVRTPSAPFGIAPQASVAGASSSLLGALVSCTGSWQYGKTL